VPSLIRGTDVEAVTIAVVCDQHNMRSLPRIMSDWSSNLKKADSLARHHVSTSTRSDLPH